MAVSYAMNLIVFRRYYTKEYESHQSYSVFTNLRAKFQNLNADDFNCKTEVLRYESCNNAKECMHRINNVRRQLLTVFLNFEQISKLNCRRLPFLLK